MYKTLIIAFLIAVIPCSTTAGESASATYCIPAASAGPIAAIPLGASRVRLPDQDQEQQNSYFKTGIQSDDIGRTPAISLAGGAADPNFAAAPNNAGTRELFFKMIFSVLLVLVLGAAAIYASRRLVGKIANLPGKRIKVVETAHLGPRKAVHLLRIGDRCLLVGSTNDSITKLADLTTDILVQDKAFAEGTPGQSPDSDPAETHGINSSTEFGPRPSETLANLSTMYTENN
ncbi:MAG: flagellar biosynthetic protein FliO [Phycisphaerae bacterium]|nr:flagellar biosynthetic protein FliO [Phycisphaerae bacterium]